MIKEIVYLGNGIVNVVDDNGNSTKKLDEKNLLDILETENKLENIRLIINNLQNEIKECKKFDSNCIKLFKFLPVLIVLHIIITLLLGVTMPYVIGGALFFTATSTLLTGVSKKYNNKIQKRLNDKLRISRDFQQKYEKELNESTLKSSINIKNDDIVNKVNQVIPIKYSEYFDENIVNDINLKYEEKVLTRTRKR